MYQNGCFLYSRTFQDVDNVTPEERQVRLKKADSIRKMLADTSSGPLAGKFFVYYFINRFHDRMVNKVCSNL